MAGVGVARLSVTVVADADDAAGACDGVAAAADVELAPDVPTRPCEPTEEMATIRSTKLYTMWSINDIFRGDLRLNR